MTENTYLQHIMTDLETLGTSNRAAILTIGAVRFDPETGEMFERFYDAVDHEDTVKYGLVDQRVVEWWERQSPAAVEAAFAGTKPLKEVLESFKEFFLRTHAGPNTPIWGNGATFDVAILESAFDITSISIPWAYNSARDVRTLVELCKGYIDRPELTEGTAHNALDDAVHQAKYVSAMYRAVRKGLRKL